MISRFLVRFCSSALLLLHAVVQGFINLLSAIRMSLKVVQAVDKGCSTCLPSECATEISNMTTPISAFKSDRHVSHPGTSIQGCAAMSETRMPSEDVSLEENIQAAARRLQEFCSHFRQGRSSEFSCIDESHPGTIEEDPAGEEEEQENSDVVSVSEISFVHLDTDYGAIIIIVQVFFFFCLLVAFSLSLTCCVLCFCLPVHLNI